MWMAPGNPFPAKQSLAGCPAADSLGPAGLQKPARGKAQGRNGPSKGDTIGGHGLLAGSPQKLRRTLMIGRLQGGCGSLGGASFDENGRSEGTRNSKWGRGRGNTRCARKQEQHCEGQQPHQRRRERYRPSTDRGAAGSVEGLRTGPAEVDSWKHDDTSGHSSSHRENRSCSLSARQ